MRIRWGGPSRSRTTTPTVESPGSAGGPASPGPTFAERKGKILLERGNAQDVVQARDLEPLQPHGVPLHDPKPDEHIVALPAHQRVDHRAHVAALPVQQQQPHYVAAELQLVEVPLLAQEPDPAQPPDAREKARVGGGDRRAQRVVVDSLVAVERKTAHHSLLLLRGQREGGRRENGDEHEADAGTQLTGSPDSPMLAATRPTVNLFDT